MDSSQKPPTAQMWLQDFRDGLKLSPVAKDAWRALIFEKYPDAGWAHEYYFSMWNAYCYFLKHSKMWEDAGLVVMGKKQSIVKDCVLVALRKPFLGSPLETLHKLDLPIEPIIENAKRIGDPKIRTG